MNTGLVASRYAQALLLYAQQRGVTSEVYKDILSLQNSLGNADAFSRAVSSCREDTLHFLQFVSQKSRGDFLPFILNSYVQKYRTSKGIAAVCLTTAAETSPSDLERFRELLQAQGYKQMEFETKVNPDLLGGFVLQVQDLRLDASLKTQLNSLRKEFESRNINI